MFFRQVNKGAKVFGEAVASVADSGVEKLRADAASRPMPRATAVTSAPTFSHRSETMLMKEILVERKALAACLINSAVLMSVTTIGRPRGP